MDITENHLAGIRYIVMTNQLCQTHIKKAGIATGKFVRQMTLTRKMFLDILQTLACRGRNIFVIAEGGATG